MPKQSKKNMSKKWGTRWRWCAADSWRPWPQPRLGRPLLHTTPPASLAPESGKLDFSHCANCISLSQTNVFLSVHQLHLYQSQPILRSVRLCEVVDDEDGKEENDDNKEDHSDAEKLEEVSDADDNDHMNCVLTLVNFWSESRVRRREMFLWPARLPGDSVHTPSSVFVCWMYLCICISVYLCRQL